MLYTRDGKKILKFYGAIEDSQPYFDIVKSVHSDVRVIETHEKCGNTIVSAMISDVSTYLKNFVFNLNIRIDENCENLSLN